MTESKTIEEFLAAAIVREMIHRLGPFPQHNQELARLAALTVLNRFMAEIKSDPKMTYQEFLLKGFC